MILENSRHEKFCQLVAAGSSASAAYIQSGYDSKDPNVHGPRLMANDRINNRINELKRESVEKCRISKGQLIDYLVDVIQTPAGEVSRDHKLCQGYKDTEVSNEIKMPDKLKAAEILCKLTGWNEPEKVTHEAGDTLTTFLQKLRSGQ